ncbi:MAG TPA: Fic family protein [Actinomycetales bacterium]|nr:Fic family protein [Actinomycetales bacterium]
MARWEERRWESSAGSGLPRSARRSGPYLTYIPDVLRDIPLRIPQELDLSLGIAEREVRGLDDGSSASDLAGLARFLLRSEAIASSRIEGIAPTARQVALAELAEIEAEVKGFGAQAEEVARNLTVVREASTRLVREPTLTTAAVVDLHAALLADGPQHHGLRTVQNWIGGSDFHPIEAQFVPPPPELVPNLIDDLIGYVNGAAHSALVQAALVHAQFETIHPFTDGNGRVGRALIHTVFARRGLTPGWLLPISLVLGTFRDRYIGGLTHYRYTGDTNGEAAQDGRVRWIAEFTQATLLAAEEAFRLRAAVAQLRTEWEERIQEHRAAAGRKRQLRSDSASSLILADLPSTPVMTAQTVQRIHQVSAPAANSALSELADAGILTEASAGPRVRAFSALDVLELVTLSERRLASTRFDTRLSPPTRPVPALPERSQLHD